MWTSLICRARDYIFEKCNFIFFIGCITQSLVFSYRNGRNGIYILNLSTLSVNTLLFYFNFRKTWVLLLSSTTKRSQKSSIVPCKTQKKKLLFCFFEDLTYYYLQVNYFLLRCSFKMVALECFSLIMIIQMDHKFQSN